jgi:integrase
LFRVTLRRLDLAEEVYHIREPEKLPLVMSVDEMKRLLAVASSLKTRVLLSLGYGCGLRASEIVRLKVKHIDKAQKIIRIEQSKGRKDRNVMLPQEMLGLLRQWWRVRPSRHDAGIPLPERWLVSQQKVCGQADQLAIQVGGLLQAPLRRSEASLALSRPLHPPRRHFQSPLDRMQRERRHFKWKDYRLEGPDRYKVMTLATHEFIRRFLMHLLPAGFHRIRYYGLLASGKRAENVARARELLMPPIIPVDAIKAISPNAAEPQTECILAPAAAAA